MLESRRYFYVGFMCHQSVEKILKGYLFLKTRETPPYSHNLFRLAEISGLLTKLSPDHRKTLTLLQPLNIEARYPKYKDSIFRSLTKQKAFGILEKTIKLQKWVK